MHFKHILAQISAEKRVFLCLNKVLMHLQGLLPGVRVPCYATMRDHFKILKHTWFTNKKKIISSIIVLFPDIKHLYQLQLNCLIFEKVQHGGEYVFVFLLIQSWPC